MCAQVFGLVNEVNGDLFCLVIITKKTTRLNKLAKKGEEANALRKKLEEILNFNYAQRWMFGYRRLSKQYVETFVAINKNKLAVEKNKEEKMNTLHLLGMQKLKLGGFGCIFVFTSNVVSKQATRKAWRI